MVNKICKNCGNEFSVIDCRKDTALYCCRKCADEGQKADNNVTCSYCGKKFHLKKSRIERYNRNLGIFCSRECCNKAKKVAYKGEGNHQYGLKGELNGSFKGDEITQKNHKLMEIMVYCPDHPYADKSGRVKKHRLIVEQNYSLFNNKYFEIINNKIVLKRTSQVHHIDGNHNNNDINNLIPCTLSEHRKFHKTIITERDNKGRIVKYETAVVKPSELLGSPEEDN